MCIRVGLMFKQRSLAVLTRYAALGYCTGFLHYPMIANLGHSLQNCKIPPKLKSTRYMSQQTPRQTSWTLSFTPTPMISTNPFTPHLIPMITAIAISTVVPPLIVNYHHQRSQKSTRKRRAIYTLLAPLRIAAVTVIITTTVTTSGRCLRPTSVPPLLRTRIPMVIRDHDLPAFISPMCLIAPRFPSHRRSLSFTTEWCSRKKPGSSQDTRQRLARQPRFRQSFQRGGYGEQ